ncbi:MAG: hypothetical protein MI867_07885 [Pseudomonadales bacterium]|nr:hypothetical protein [Pseudomonadales bacterium]
MNKSKPSKTALKVAMNLVTLSTKPGMESLIPVGLIEATEKLLISSGEVSPRMMRWAHSPKMLSIYEAFNFLLPGQFEAFAHRKMLIETQTRKAIEAGVEHYVVAEKCSK